MSAALVPLIVCDRCSAEWVDGSMCDVTDARENAWFGGWRTRWESRDGVERSRLIDLCPNCAARAGA